MTLKLPHDLPAHLNAVLLLADDTIFLGSGVGARETVFGEICFNTGMTGYQEVMTDLSYAGQIVCFTFPHIGNTGANEEDLESHAPACRGLVLREPISSPSNFRSYQHFNDWLVEHEITGISGVDTRALTRHIRKHGAQNAAIQFREENQSFDLTALRTALANQGSLEGRDLASLVTTQESYTWNQRCWKLGDGYSKAKETPYHVVAIDYGEKLNILRCLAERGCKVTVVPATLPAAEILSLKPDGIFLSNGPADPAATGRYAVPILQELIASGKPIFGICLGHQLLALAMGAQTEKLHQGHRGANHPVKNLLTGKVEITSQNHGFAVVYSSLPTSLKVTHLSLFDNTIEGLQAVDKPVFSVQYHPESSPGPHDSQYLFDQFIGMMQKAA
jgi:carbamoyl-phosphate synthase small subunit